MIAGGVREGEFEREGDRGVQPSHERAERRSSRSRHWSVLSSLLMFRMRHSRGAGRKDFGEAPIGRRSHRHAE